jgi:hypothetical protein
VRLLTGTPVHNRKEIGRMFLNIKGCAHLTERKKYVSPKKSHGQIAPKHLAGWRELAHEQEHGPASVFRRVPAPVRTMITGNITLPPPKKRPRRSTKPVERHLSFVELQRVDHGGLRFDCVRVR